MQPRYRIWLLLVAHVVADVVLLMLLYVHAFPAVTRYALPIFVLSQLGLLGIWCGLSTTAWWRRLTVMLLGILLLMGVMSLAISILVGQLASAPMSSLFLLSFLDLLKTEVPSVTAIVVILVALRSWRFDLRRINGQSPAPSSASLQFSILHLMLLTLVLAVFAACTQVTNLTVLRFTMSILQNSTIALLAVWAALGVTQPRVPCITAIAASAAVGVVWPLSLWQSLSAAWSDLLFGSIFTGIQGALVIGSLLVIRSCEPRISLITLGVHYLERSFRFYRDGLGLPTTWGKPHHCEH